MKIKYYLRGLGVGIVITTLILLIVFNTTGKNISDEEVVARAKALGMVMAESKDEDTTSGKLSETFGKDKELQITDNNDSDEKTDSDEKQDEKVNEEDKSNKDDTVTKDNKTEENKTEGNKTNDDKPENKEENNPKNEVNNDEKSDEDNSKIDAANTNEEQTPILDGTTNSIKPNGKEASVNVIKGDSSRIVSEKLQAAGIVGDAEDFNKFMKNGGYADRIKVGRVVINIGETYKNIAKILTEK